jgi:hypothetical protein
MTDGAAQGGSDQAADRSELADVLAVATQAGLVLSDEDADRLIVAARRIRAMAAEVRQLASPGVEPSGPAVSPWPTRRR